MRQPSMQRDAVTLRLLIVALEHCVETTWAPSLPSGTQQGTVVYGW